MMSGADCVWASELILSKAHIPFILFFSTNLGHYSFSRFQDVVFENIFDKKVKIEAVRPLDPGRAVLGRRLIVRVTSALQGAVI